MHWTWIWIISLLLALVSEAIIKRRVSFWLAPASAVAVILDVLQLWFVIQLAAFVAVAIPSFLLLRRYAIHISLIGSASTSIDNVVGKKCTVIDRIDSYAGCGQVDVKGTRWSARGLTDDDTFEVGEVLSVVAVEGVKLICKKQS